MNRQAPIFTDAFELCQWILERLNNEQSFLAGQICQTALLLLQYLTLALKGRNRELRLDEADEQLITLRLQLRLSVAIGLLQEPQMLYALEYTDRIGRQIGGWQRSLNSA